MSTMYQTPRLAGLVDVAPEFWKPENQLYFCHKATSFDAERATGLLQWQRHVRSAHVHFNYMEFRPSPAPPGEFPPEVYVQDPALPFSLEFVSPRAVRLRMDIAAERRAPMEELMLAGPVPKDTWQRAVTPQGVTYTSRAGISLALSLDPWGLEIRNEHGRLVTQSCAAGQRRAMPFAFVRRAADLRRHLAAAFTLSPDEMIFGGGESFTRLDKRGQKVFLWTFDAWECQGAEMYKPVPFFLSSQGYGMFIHTSAPVTLDVGHTHDHLHTIYSGDDALDLFIFVGTPEEILAEYTSLTGRSPVPPLWSFGLWMSRITYDRESQVRAVAARLREERIPCDVIHLDTGWFEVDWCCDYRFSTTRFSDPKKMLADLRTIGFRTCLWQLPYFTPKNRLYREIIERGYAVRADGGIPTEDAILDFSNPEAVRWYQDLLAGLFEIGAAAIKVDFGEAAPLLGQFKSGRSGFYEHNLYPLRYNKAAADVTHEKTGEHVIWARSAWAGSQRYPLHWGGDTHVSNGGMAAEIRAGVSFGLSGFSFWSHDIGGFAGVPDADLYARWLAFGMLCSHSRCHGYPPREPWEFGDDFVPIFRRIVELKYRLMPYVYAQAHESARRGLPMVRALFLEFPEDRGSWLVEDEYLFGRDLLVAPLLEHRAKGREVYLPPGAWHDWQTRDVHEGARWVRIEAGELPIILLVRDGAALPMAPLAQSTDDIDWEALTLRAYSRGAAARGSIMRPGQERPLSIELARQGSRWSLVTAGAGRLAIE